MEASMAVLPLILDIVFVLIGVLIIWRCARNGFIKCLFKLIRTALALFLASLLVAPVAPVAPAAPKAEPVKREKPKASADEELDRLMKECGTPKKTKINR